MLLPKLTLIYLLVCQIKNSKCHGRNPDRLSNLLLILIHIHVYIGVRILNISAYFNISCPAFKGMLDLNAWNKSSYDLLKVV